MKEICVEISKRYEIMFTEIGAIKIMFIFLIQSVPMESPTKIIRTVKRITAKEIFKLHPEVMQKLWGGEFWSKGFYVYTDGKHGDENTIQAYVKSQGNEKTYKKYIVSSYRSFNLKPTHLPILNLVVFQFL